LLVIRVRARGMVFEVPVASGAVSVTPADPWGGYSTAMTVVNHALRPLGVDVEGVELADAWVPTRGFLRYVSVVDEEVGLTRVDAVELVAPPVRVKAGDTIHARLGAIGDSVCVDVHGTIKCLDVEGEDDGVEAAGYLAFASAARRLADVREPRATMLHRRVLEGIWSSGYTDAAGVVLLPRLPPEESHVLFINPHPDAVEHAAAVLYTLASAGAAVVVFTPRPGEVRSALAALAASRARMLDRDTLAELARLPRPRILEGSWSGSPARKRRRASGFWEALGA